nr:unnamed protein product [Danio rerio]
MLSGVVWACVLVLLGVFCAGSDVVPVSVSVKEGDSVTLLNDVKITKQDKIRWYFNDTLIARIYLSNNKTWTDVQCNDERFRDRLKLDHQTGSLTVMNTRSTDSGEYQLDVIYTGGDKEKTFSVTVLSVSAVDKHKKEKDQEGESDTSDTGSGLSTVAVIGMCVALLLVICAAVAAICKLLLRRKDALGVLQENAEPLAAANENP